MELNVVLKYYSFLNFDGVKPEAWRRIVQRVLFCHYRVVQNVGTLG